MRRDITNVFPVLTALSKLLHFSVPISMTNIIGILVNFFAIMMVGRLGQAPLAASALATATYTTIMLIATTSLYAVSILISHEKHAAESSNQKIAAIFKNGSWMACLVGIVAAFLLWHADKVLWLFQQDETLIELARPYFQYSSFAIIPIMLSTVSAQFFIGVGTPYFTLLTSLLRLPFILFFSYALILGKFGMPQLGLAGVMAATLFVQIIYCIGLWLNLFFNKHFSQYPLFSQFFRIEWSIIYRIFKVGYPIGVQYGGELLIMSLITYLMGYYGTTALAASQIVSQYGLLIVMLLHGIGQGMSALVSAAYSQHNLKLIHDYLKSAYLLIGGVFFALLWIYAHPEWLVYQFISDPNEITPTLIYYARNLFIIAAFSLCIDAIRIYLTSILRGMQSTQYPMYVGMICLSLISLPTACFSAFILNWGPIGLNLGFISGILIASFILHYKLKQLLIQQEGHAYSKMVVS